MERGAEFRRIVEVDALVVGIDDPAFPHAGGRVDGLLYSHLMAVETGGKHFDDKIGRAVDAVRLKPCGFGIRDLDEVGLEDVRVVEEDIDRRAEKLAPRWISGCFCRAKARCR
jgi:hypothetical protein